MDRKRFQLFELSRFRAIRFASILQSTMRLIERTVTASRASSISAASALATHSLSPSSFASVIVK